MTMPNVAPPPQGDAQAQLRAMLAKLSAMFGGGAAPAPQSPESTMYNEAVGPSRAGLKHGLAAPHATTGASMTEEESQRIAENDLRGGKSFADYHGGAGRPVGTAQESQRGLLRELLTRLSGGEMGR